MYILKLERNKQQRKIEHNILRCQFTINLILLQISDCLVEDVPELQIIPAVCTIEDENGVEPPAKKLKLSAD